MVLFGGDTLLDRSAYSTTSSNTSTRSLNSGQDVDAFINSRKVTGYTYAKTRSYNRNYPDHYEHPKLLSQFAEVVDNVVSYAAECVRSVRKSVARTNAKRSYDMPSPTELFKAHRSSTKEESGGIFCWKFVVLCLLLFIGTLCALHLYDQSSSTSAIELVQTCQDASNTILQELNSDHSDLKCPNLDLSNLQDTNSGLCHPLKHHFVCECKCKCNKREQFEVKIQGQFSGDNNNNNPAPLATITEEHDKSADQTSSASLFCNNSDNKLQHQDDGPSLNMTSSNKGVYKYRNISKSTPTATWIEMIRITPSFWLLDLQ